MAAAYKYKHYIDIITEDSYRWRLRWSIGTNHMSGRDGGVKRNPVSNIFKSLSDRGKSRRKICSEDECFRAAYSNEWWEKDTSVIACGGQSQFLVRYKRHHTWNLCIPSKDIKHTDSCQQIFHPPRQQVYDKDYIRAGS